MNSPAAALTWELWRKHGRRFLVLVGAMLMFAMFYPKLCAFNGIDLNAPNAMDALETAFSSRVQQASELGKIPQVLLALFLLLGPIGFQVLCDLGFYFH